MLNNLWVGNAKDLTRLKPIVSELNWEKIHEKLWEMQEKVEDVKWFADEDNIEALTNALDGDMDDAFEFRMAFSDLSGELYQMECDLRDYDDSYISEFFDKFIGSCGIEDEFGGFLGIESSIGDYSGINPYCDSRIEELLQSSLVKLTKKEILDTAAISIRILVNYLSLCSRYENLKHALDILSKENLDVLKAVGRINELYELVWDKKGLFNGNKKYYEEWEKVLDALPRETWVA